MTGIYSHSSVNPFYLSILNLYVYSCGYKIVTNLNSHICMHKVFGWSLYVFILHPHPMKFA